MDEDDLDEIELRLEEANELFEACEFEKAECICREVECEFPGRPDTAWCMGLILERTNTAMAETYFKRAHSLNPEDFPLPLDIDDEEIKKAVIHLINKLPSDIREKIQEVPIIIEGIPSDEDVYSSDPPLEPSICGLFRGYTWPDEHSTVQVSGMNPPEIVIYKKNIAREVDSKTQFLREVKITVLHELAHYFGLNEEAVAKLRF